MLISTADALPPEPLADPRKALRRRLLAARDGFVAGGSASASQAALAGHLRAVLAELMPDCLGLYWPLRSEFNAAAACFADRAMQSTAVALPFARKASREIVFRLWDRAEPRARDECGIASSDGAEVTPDVVLVPCVGFTPSGFRLGYGGGYYDRWLAAHPGVTAVGIGWSVGSISDAELAPQPHDQALMLVVTEHGLVGG